MSMTTEPKCDLSKRTDQQNIHRLNQQLNAIWRIGDRDECSIKHVGHAMAGRMGGAVTTEMNSGKHMKKMVSRGLLRSPIKGIRYLKESMAALRNGPAMKRPTTAEKKQ